MLVLVYVMIIKKSIDILYIFYQNICSYCTIFVREKEILIATKIIGTEGLEPSLRTQTIALPTELRSNSASGLKTVIVIADTTHAEASTLSAATKSGIVNLSEVLRIRSVHPGAPRQLPLPSCDPRQRFQGN